MRGGHQHFLSFQCVSSTYHIDTLLLLPQAGGHFKKLKISQPSLATPIFPFSQTLLGRASTQALSKYHAHQPDPAALRQISSQEHFPVA